MQKYCKLNFILFFGFLLVTAGFRLNLVMDPGTDIKPASPIPATYAREMNYQDPENDLIYRNLTSGEWYPSPISCPEIDLLNVTLYNSTSPDNYTVIMQLADNVNDSDAYHWEIDVKYNYQDLPGSYLEGKVMLECYPNTPYGTGLNFLARHYEPDRGFIETSNCGGYNDSVNTTWTFPKSWIPAQDKYGDNITEIWLWAFTNLESAQYRINDNLTNSIMIYLSSPPSGGTGGQNNPDGGNPIPNPGIPPTDFPWAILLGCVAAGVALVGVVSWKKKQGSR